MTKAVEKSSDHVAMPLRPALEVVQQLRREQLRDAIVVTTMGSAREWPKLGPADPLDFQYLPSAMGMRRCSRSGLRWLSRSAEVVAFNGDGGMLDEPRLFGDRRRVG
ncbi:MAG: hypothetical protein QM775_35975 [Pirellulales bacterium]